MSQPSTHPPLRHRHRVAWFIVGALAAVAVLLPVFHEETEFIMGGALVNAGYRLQDRIHHFDFKHDDAISAEDIWKELEHQNQLASAVRKQFPRSTHHPVVAMVVCMDARLDTNELVGDTRKYYYVIRTAGSVLGEREQEMLELAVDNGVRVLVLTTHTDCAAERVAADPQKRALYPHLTTAVDEREARFAEFTQRPRIRERIQAGTLLVKRMVVDTHDERIHAP